MVLVAKGLYVEEEEEEGEVLEREAWTVVEAEKVRAWSVFWTFRIEVCDEDWARRRPRGAVSRDWVD
jgi:hypothetical protein